MPDKTFPGESKEAHPELFTERPPQVSESKPGQLNQQQIDQYWKEGYVLVRQFFEKEELDPCLKAIEKKVDDVANKLYNAGKIKDLHQDYGVYQRMTMIEKEFHGSTVILHKLGVLPEEFKKVWANERLLNATEQLLGPNIAGHAVWNLRVKTPDNPEATVPWHQDIGYTDNEQYKVHVPTMWVPLLDVDEVNGCLQFYRRGHRTGKVAKHECCFGPTWYLMLSEAEMEKTLDIDLKEDLVTLPMKYGDIVLFNNFIPHQSLENHSDKTRWSLDLRFQDPAKPSGFYGVKQSVPFRLADQPDLKIDWERLYNRNTDTAKFLKEKTDEFDATISGPWMRKWEIVHVNKHTEALPKA